MRNALRFGSVSLFLLATACGDDTAETGNGGGGASASSSSVAGPSSGSTGSTSTGATSSASQSATATATVSASSGSSGSGDGGGGSSGDGGAGAGGTGGDAGTGGEGGALPICVVDATATIEVPGFQIETIAEGDPLVDPVGLMFGLDGELYVGNSHSWVTNPSEAPAEIYRVDGDGGFTLLVTDNRMRGTAWAAFAPGGEPGGPGIAYMASEDAYEGSSPPHGTDWILSYDGSAITEGPDTYEVGKLRFGPGGAFGDDLYWAGREVSKGPGTITLLRWDLAGSPESLPIAIDGQHIDVAGFDFANGGDLGEDLYTWSIDDDDGAGPAAIWRVDETFSATHLVDFFAFDLAASPDPDGVWGDLMYVDDNEDGLHRMTADGEITAFVTGLELPGAMVFGPDAALYVTEMVGKRIRKITPCTPPED